MRTKALVGLAVLAASAATCVAQNVYSLNIVGYVNMPVEANKFYLIENPLTKASTPGGNTVSNVISVPDTFADSQIYTFGADGLKSRETFFAGFGWFPGNTVITPGTGFYLLPKAAGTVTFVGEVVLTNSVTLQPGYNMVASPYPAAMSLAGLGLTGQADDLVVRYDAASQKLMQPVTFFAGYGWFDANVTGGGPPEGPTLNVGEGIWYSVKATPFTWKQEFKVGP